LEGFIFVIRGLKCVEYAKFILCGEDKKALSGIKSSLTASGHIFLGYSKEPFNILRHIRNLSPDMVIIEVQNNFRDLRQILEVVDEEILSACILLLDSRSDEIFDFLRKTRIMTYVAKPIFDDTLVQIVDISLANYKRITDYEKRVEKLNNSLESRKVIEKAKWLIVEQENLSEAEAYEIIKRKSRDNRMPMRDIADAIIITRSSEKNEG